MRKFTFSPDDPVGRYLEVYPQAGSVIGSRMAEVDAAPDGATYLRLAIECRLEPVPGSAHDRSQYGIGELIDHIEATHHPFLYAELGRFQVLIDHLAGGELSLRVQRWSDGLREHMDHEEKELFPLCRILESNRDERADQDPEKQLHGMYRGHEDAEADLVFICESLGEIGGDEAALASARRALADVITDLHQHIELEDSVLLPAVLFQNDLRKTRTFRKSRLLRALEPKNHGG